jgi:hypothetical protein
MGSRCDTAPFLDFFVAHKAPGDPKPSTHLGVIHAIGQAGSTHEIRIYSKASAEPRIT